MGEDSYVAIGIDGLTGAFEVSNNTFNGVGSVKGDIELFNTADGLLQTNATVIKK